MPKTCPHCKSSELDTDPARGDTVCTGCGSVLEENTIVSEVSFVSNSDGSSSMVGQFVSGEGSNQPHFVGFRHSLGKESRRLTLDRGRREIKEMASGLHLNQHCIETANGFFKVAISKRLSRGRKIQHIVAACLYMTCRVVGTPHMLLDFSDITQVNVFTLGKTFLTLAKELHIQLPVLGYLSRKKHFSELRRATSPHSTTYWRPGTYDQWRWHSKAGSTVVSVKMMQDGSSAVYPRLTDDRNLKASSLSNTFNATTRLREVPVTGIFRKEIQDLHCRSPSARGVRSIPLTNRSLIVPPQSVKSSYMALQTADDFGGRLKGSQQAMRHILELERMEKTREMKRHAQISAHRMDRMYYMNAAPVKLHNRYSITDVDLERLQQIAVSQGIRISTTASSYQSKSNGKTLSAPNSSPRDLRRSSDGGSGSKTIIPTADTISIGADYISDDGTSERATDQSGKEDAATSDHDNDVEDSRNLETEVTRSSEKVRTQNSDNDDVETEKKLNPRPSTGNTSIVDDGDNIKSETGVFSLETVNAPLEINMSLREDPCMYIARFAHCMDFGDMTHDVSVSAMRLVSRMKRDWLHTGRRPSGLCGAALLVAARMHGYTCTLSDVVKVVKIGHDTIRKRLTEFVSTPSSQLTINEFMSIDLESEADPPCFTESRLKQKQANMEQLEAQIGQLSNAIDQELEKTKRVSKATDPPENDAHPVSDYTQDPDMKSAANFIHSENPEEVAKGLSKKFQNESELPATNSMLQGPLPTTSSLGLKDAPKDINTSVATISTAAEQSDVLNLDGINDEEINQLILTPSESMIKTRLWMAENGEYLKEMEVKAEKRRLEEEEKEKTRPKKAKKKLVPRKDYYANSQSAGEAIEKLIKRSKLSSKINYDALKRATSDLPQEPVTPKPKFLDSFASLAKYDMAPKIESPFADDPIIEEYMPKPKIRKTEKVSPCLDPMPIEMVKPEAVVEIEGSDLFGEPIEETGPVTAAVEEVGPDDYEDDDNNNNCLSVSQLMQKAGVGSTTYGDYYKYDGYEEYD